MGVEHAGEAGFGRRRRYEARGCPATGRARAFRHRAVDTRAQAKEHGALPVERRPHHLALGAIRHRHTGERVDDLEQLGVRCRVKAFALAALTPQRTHARGRPGGDHRGLTVDQVGEVTAGGVIEAGAGDEHGA